jgi:hypothetical protein
MLDYWCRPGRRASWGGPFNGQVFRQRLFAELCRRIQFTAIVETGTHQGTTTEYLSSTARVPVHSFELVPHRYGFARARLRAAPGVHLHHRDSRAGLAELAMGRALPPGPLFFYLDAHGLPELPLAEEIDLVFGHWGEAIVMIDDFAVPDDPGYGFDDYGPGQVLTLDYLGSRAAPPMALWLPACVSAAESGARRGCVVLARDAALVRRMNEMETLRRWDLAVEWSRAGDGSLRGPRLTPGPGCPAVRPRRVEPESFAAAP